MTERNLNPYQQVNWDAVTPIIGCTHLHCTDGKQLQDLIAQGLKFVTLSNYYPSAPYYPLKDMRRNSFRCHMPNVIQHGVSLNHTIDLNEIMVQNADGLPDDLKQQLPFAEGEPLFPNLPPDILEAPNAEHHHFSNANEYLHLCALGSNFASGSFDPKNQFGLVSHGIRRGCPIPWQNAISLMMQNLLCPEGGGVIIAHPTWSHLPVHVIHEILDFDSRVLGIEIYNHNSIDAFADFSDSIWDQILSTGRQCFGFCVQDHPMKNWQGMSILLPQENTAMSCLKAYREGRFYGAITNSGLRFEAINFDGEQFYARCNHPCFFQLISKQGIINPWCDNQRELLVNIPQKDRQKHGFLRLTAQDYQHCEKLFAQPIIL